MTTNAEAWPTEPSPTPVPVAATRQATPKLQRLLATLERERAAMTRALHAQPSNAADQKQARQALLASLEAYALALSNRNLPVPLRLRDELFLQRQLATASRPPGRQTPASERHTARPTPNSALTD